MQFGYIQLAPGFAREVIEVYDTWKSKVDIPVPIKVQELMLVLRIEVSRLYKDDERPVESVKAKSPILEDMRLG